MNTFNVVLVWVLVAAASVYSAQAGNNSKLVFSDSEALLIIVD